MTKYQEWKLYGRYVLRRIGKRVRSSLSRLFPGISPAAKKPRTKRDLPIARQAGQDMISIIQAKDRLPLLTEHIVDTYAEIGGTVHLGRCPMPTYNTVVSIIEDLKSVLFPGYRRRDSLRLSDLIYHVGNLIDTLYDRLTHKSRGP